MYKKRLLNRRHALKLGLATLAGMGACVKGKSLDLGQQAQVLDYSERDFAVVGESPLKERAAAKGLIYGSSASMRNLPTDAEFTASFVKECGMVVPGFEFRWYVLRPSPDNFNFKHSDWMVEWAKTHNMLLRGHTLVWNQSMPKWFQSKVNRQNAEQVMVDHITKVVGQYAGQIHSWDVVNEAVNPKSGRSDSLLNSFWLQLLGPDYIELAFRAAAEADPEALLVYNDAWMNTDTKHGETVRFNVLKLLERLKSKGTPIHALGMQAHIWGKDKKPLNPKKIRAFLREVADLGLKIMVTELDVLDRHLPKDIEVRDRIVAQAYEDYLSAVLDEPAVIAVITWGLSDRYTWRSKPKFGARTDGATVRPLPLDDQMNRKLAWNAMARAFDNAPKR